ncbi:MAG TPA: phosphatase PAP2 family protein [Candidatus Limnocylindrales bacterium]
MTDTGGGGREPAASSAVAATAAAQAVAPGSLDSASEPQPDLELGRRNDRILLIAIGGYTLLLSALMIARGVSITPDVLLVAFGLAAVLLGRGRLFLRDWIPFIGLFFAYELMRGYADNFGASVHVTDVLAVERALFLGHLPTQVLQDAFHPATGNDPLAMVATIFYFLHFPLPIAVGFFLWFRRRRAFYDYVAALIVLSMAGFVTYLVLPVAPPWWAAKEGFIPGPGGPAIAYLKDQGFSELARLFGFEGHYLYSYTVYDINPNQVAAFPSLHAGYPFLAFLFARRTFGRVGWLMVAYSVCVWFSIVYLADHYVVDILAGLAYASIAYWAVIHAPGWFRRLVERAADTELDAGVEAADRGERGALRRLGRQVRPAVVGQGAVAAVAGAVGIALMAFTGAAGGSGTVLYLVPWLVMIGGLWRAAAGVLSR